jgi:RNA polymerase sigma-70 factor (ECF subfamily)
LSHRHFLFTAGNPVCKKTGNAATTSIVEERDEWYRQAAAEFGPALVRLARAYEIDPEKRRDLLQEIHLALWRSFAGFDARCSMRTWIYRVAHDSAASYAIRQKRSRRELLIGLEDTEAIPVAADADHRMALDRLTELIQRLKPLDREVILSYLEGMDAAEIGELTGISARNVATKVHRIKTILARNFHEGERHAG